KCPFSRISQGHPCNTAPPQEPIQTASWLAHTGYSRANQRYVSSPSHRSDGVIPFAAIMLLSAVPRNGTLSGYFPFGLSSTPYMRTTYLPSSSSVPWSTVSAGTCRSQTRTWDRTAPGSITEYPITYAFSIYAPAPTDARLP